MNSRRFNTFLLISSTATLLLGFRIDAFWILAGFIGLIPATTWLIQDLRHKTMGSDLLAVLALVGSLLTDELFAAAVISVMLATGRVLESWAEGQAERQLKSLLSRMPRVVHRVKNDSTIEEIDIELVAIGDKLLIRAGEITPTDGHLLAEATLDESALTGEPLPVNRLIGDEISSGILNAGSPFEYVASSTSQDSTYAGIIALVKAAQAKSAPGVRIANQWALRFVPVALTIAAGAWIITGDVKRAIAVLVAATPCPLILAVPIAIVAGLSQAAKSGAIIKGGAILEALARTETVLLDKTGTLTHGGPEISDINTAPGLSDDELLQIAASVDQYSPHIVAKALVHEARRRSLELSTCTDLDEIPGHQISGTLNGVRYVVGQIEQQLPSWLHFSQPLMVGVTADGDLIGIIGLDDPIRPESRAMVAELSQVGVSHIALVTGDRDETAQAVAKSVGITEVFSKVSAEGKLEIARSAMQRSSGTVVVVGDGINDAPALAAADVGVAMGARGASAASEAADVVIVEDSIDRLTTAIRIAKKSRKKALEAAGLGMGLSLIAMFLGAFGFLTPSQGAIAQEFIDIAAILWALTALAA
ncbi:ZntA Cation transport ATPase [Candidatus Nanopelagicaceae bacterium]